MAENRDSLLSACSALVNKGRWNEAIARLDQALQDNPGDLLVAFALANILNRKGDYSRAKELFNRIKAALPDMAAASLGLADSLIGLEEIDAAHTVIKAETVKSPSHGDCYQMLGKIASAKATSLQRPITSNVLIYLIQTISNPKRISQKF